MTVGSGVTKHRRATRIYRRAIAVTIFAFACFGCLGRNGDPSLAARPSFPSAVANPVGAVVANCRELVCTQADVPSCDFEQVTQGIEVAPIIDEVHCARSEFGTDCEERRAADQNHHGGGSQVLKFRCAGDPVECWLTGGNATWETTLDLKLDGGKPLQYPCRHVRPGPPLTTPGVPGPDTV